MNAHSNGDLGEVVFACRWKNYFAGSDILRNFAASFTEQEEVIQRIKELAVQAVGNHITVTGVGKTVSARRFSR